MKTLPESFERKGWHFRQIQRDGRVAVFERSKQEQKHFETVVILPYPAREALGRWVEAGESYPSTEQWGKYGFTYSAQSHENPLAAAIAKAEALR